MTLSLCSNHWKIQNSIRRLANGRSEANDVSLLWRHSSWSRSWRLERACIRPFLTVLGNLNPKMLSAIVWTQKGTSLRHNACFEPSCVKFHARVPSVGESGKKIKNNNKKERPCISRISPGVFLRPIGTNFGLRVRLVDVINCAKFYRNRLRGLDTVRGRSLTIPIGLQCRR